MVPIAMGGKTLRVAAVHDGTLGTKSHIRLVEPTIGMSVRAHGPGTTPEINITIGVSKPIEVTGTFNGVQTDANLKLIDNWIAELQRVREVFISYAELYPSGNTVDIDKDFPGALDGLSIRKA